MPWRFWFQRVGRQKRFESKDRVTSCSHSSLSEEDTDGFFTAANGLGEENCHGWRQLQIIRAFSCHRGGPIVSPASERRLEMELEEESQHVVERDRRLRSKTVGQLGARPARTGIHLPEPLFSPQGQC